MIEEHQCPLRIFEEDLKVEARFHDYCFESVKHLFTKQAIKN
jgi:hypothetical protein